MRKIRILALFTLMATAAYPQETTGDAAAVAASSEDNGYWQGITFGAVTLAVATTAIVLIALNNGDRVESSSH